MRKNVRNDKVVKAITIGLAAMLAVTSAPVTVFADESAPAEQPEAQPAPQPAESAPAQSNPEPAPAQAQSNPETVAAAPAPVEQLNNSLDTAIAAVEAHQEATGLQMDNIIQAELTEAQNLIENTGLNDQNINTAVTNTGIAESSLKALDDTLKSKELENDNKDKKGVIRKQFIVNRDENGNLVVDENGNPEFGQKTDENGNIVDYEVKNQLSGQYGTDGRSVQGVYEDGVELVQAAIGTTDKGTAEKNIEDATKMLDAGITKFGNSTEKLRQAREEYAKAEQAAKEAEQALQDTQKLAASIKDVGKAADLINEAKENADRLAKARDQYYALMLQYFKEDVKNCVFDDNGVLDIGASIAKAQENKSAVLKGTSDAKGATFEYGRVLMMQLIEYKLISEGASSVEFGKYGDGESMGSAVTAVDKTGKEILSIKKDEKGNDQIDSFKTTGKVKWENYKAHLSDNSDSVNGRNNHVKVDYIVKDENGVEHKETKYYNYIVKSLKYEKLDDLSTGPIFVSEITKSVGADGQDVWTYTPYNSEGTGFFDNYDALNAAVAVQKTEREAVDAAADEVNKLKSDLETLQKKVATNNTELARLKAKLDIAEAAYKESKQGLEDLNDLIEAVSNKLDVAYEKREINGIDDAEEAAAEPGEITSEDKITEPSGEGSGSGSTGGSVIPGIEAAETTSYTIPGITAIGTAVAATFGTGTTLDLGSAMVTIPGFGGTGADLTNNASGVQGVREAVKEITGDTFAAKEAEEKDPVVKKVILQNRKANKKTVKLNESRVPLSAVPVEDGAHISWLWLLIIALLGATGKKMYDDHMERVKAREEAKEADK